MSYSDEQKRPADGSDRGVYMVIADGYKVYLEDPRPEDFDPRRIARALAREHRYAGQYGNYSVAQHCVLVAQTVERLCWDSDEYPSWETEQHLVLSGIHHEDSESITGDMPQPVKSLCPDFKRLEKRLQAQADIRFGTDSGHPLVKEADRIVFCAEVRCLPASYIQPLYGEYGNPDYKLDLQPTWDELVFWSPDQAEKTWLYYHEQWSK